MSRANVPPAAPAVIGPTRAGRPVLAVALLAVAASPGSAQAPGGERSLQFVTRLGGLPFVDAPPRMRTRFSRPSRGDALVFTTALSGAAGGRAGTLHAVCTITAPRRSVAASLYHCTGATVLRDGTIAVDAVGPVAADAPMTFAVTGGTAADEGARGSISSVPREGECDASDATVRLLG